MVWWRSCPFGSDGGPVRSVLLLWVSIKQTQNQSQPNWISPVQNRCSSFLIHCWFLLNETLTSGVMDEEGAVHINSFLRKMFSRDSPVEVKVSSRSPQTKPLTVMSLCVCTEWVTAGMQLQRNSTELWSNQLRGRSSWETQVGRRSTILEKCSSLRKWEGETGESGSAVSAQVKVPSPCLSHLTVNHPNAGCGNASWTTQSCHAGVLVGHVTLGAGGGGGGAEGSQSLMD